MAVHQLEHEVSGLYPSVAHGAGLAALWCSWARYVCEANTPRWLQYASRVWNLPIDHEHPMEPILKAIDLQEEYYQKIGMPVSLKELEIQESDLEILALNCSRNQTRVLPGYKELGYEDMLAIYKMAYHAGKK